MDWPSVGFGMGLGGMIATLVCWAFTSRILGQLRREYRRHAPTAGQEDDRG